MSIGSWVMVLFLRYLLNYKEYDHETWSARRYCQGQNVQNVLSELNDWGLVSGPELMLILGYTAFHHSNFIYK